MHWIRVAGSALVLLLLMTSTAVADSSVQQLEDNVRASLATVGSSADAPGPVRARESFQEPVAPKVSLGTGPMMAAVHRFESLTGGWRISAGVTPESQVLGVVNGRVVSERWTNFHISVGLPLR